MYFIPDNFTFKGSGAGGELDILTGAFERYRKFIVPVTLKSPRKSPMVGDNVAEMLEVEVSSSDESLGLETDESCKSLVDGI